MNTSAKIKIEIWSDFMCPFCYIGKRRLEEAIHDAGVSDLVSIEWKSFQLDPQLITDPETTIYRHLAIAKGITEEEARQLNKHVTEMAAATGLEYNMDSVVVANTFKAHRLSHFARTLNLQDQLEELLFAAYFTQGKNLDDNEMLTGLAATCGMPEVRTREVLESTQYAEEVRHDIEEAGSLGIRGVPFFVFNRKYAVSGAQPAEVFLKALAKARE